LWHVVGAKRLIKKSTKERKENIVWSCKKGCHPVVISLKIKLPVVMVLICLFSFQVIHEFVYSLNSLLSVSVSFFVLLSPPAPTAFYKSHSVDLNERMFNWFLRAIVLFFVCLWTERQRRQKGTNGKRRLYLTNFCLKDNLRLNVMDLWIFER